MMNLPVRKVLFVAILQFLTSLSFAQEKREEKPAPNLKEWNIKGNFKFVEDVYPSTAPIGMAWPKNNPEVEYFVTELRGAIKAKLHTGEMVEVKMDESIRQPRKELPEFDGENGLVGACLGPKDQFLFTTGVVNEGWSIVNKISKWQVDGRQLKLVEEMIEPFRKDPAGSAHQIGHCHVGLDGKLWVGVGDGHQVPSTHLKGHLNGKILRMNLDFSPAKDNPFYKAAEPKAPQNYVWAMGFRNPFALTELSPQRWLLADNGPEVDRLVEVVPGKDYPWDNTSESMLYGNLLTFYKPVGPADMVYVPEEHPLEELRGHLVIAASHDASLVKIPFDPQSGILGKHEYFLKPHDFKNRGHHNRRGDFAGLFLRDDGLYVTYIRTKPKGGLLPSAIMKLVPKEVSTEMVSYSGEQLVYQRGCRGCHSIAGVGSQQAPSLNGLVSRVEDRLQSESYLEKLKKLQNDSRAKEEAEKWKRVRKAMIEKEGSLSERVRTWIEAKIENPYFENRANAMPVFNIPEDEIPKIANFVIKVTDPQRNLTGFEKVKHKVVVNFEQNPRVATFLALLIGIGLGLFFNQTLGRLFRMLGRRFLRSK